MRSFNFLNKGLAALSLLVASALPVSAWAHGGASVDTDQCRVQIGSHLVHFTAYQPQLTGTTEYCNTIPDIGNTAIVFDYEGKALRNMTVEFEITKEPEGTRIFYQPPGTHPTGTFNTNINFTQGGKYRAHITLVNEGQKVDEHIGFTVGAEAAGPSTSTYIVAAVIIFAAGYILYLSNAKVKNAVDRLTGNKEQA
jgi:hypothetical protein